MEYVFAALAGGITAIDFQREINAAESL